MEQVDPVEPATGFVVPEAPRTEQVEQEFVRELTQAHTPTRLVPRWLAVVLLGAGVAMLPWVAGLAVILPETQQAAHYRAAWVGFDLALCLLFLRTGWLAWRGREHMELTAAMAGALLLVDAWFDVVTAPTRHDLVVATVLAVFGELPLAGFCLWIAGRVEYRRQRRATLMTRLLRRLRGH